MNLNFQAGKTPLTSRQNPVIYLAVAVVLAIAAVLLGIRFIQILRRKKMESPEYIEKEKTRPTKKKDCVQLIEKNKLNPEYKDILWYICKKFEIPNILYSINSFDQLDNCFREAYISLKENGNQKLINLLFRLKFDLDGVFATSVVYSSTHSIPVKTKLKLILKKSITVMSNLIENEKNYLTMEVPEAFLESKYKPDELDRIAFTFISKTGLPYAFITRFIRWQKQGEKTYMIVNHTHQLMTKTQRAFKRKNVNEGCVFYSAKFKKDEKGEKYAEIGQKEYTAKLMNISGGGCCISASLPIKEGQFIQLNFTACGDTVSPVGKIVKSRKTNMHGVFNLHIQFINISTEDQNKILAKVYGYE